MWRKSSLKIHLEAAARKEEWTEAAVSSWKGIRLPGARCGVLRQQSQGCNMLKSTI